MKWILGFCLLLAIGCNQGPTNYGMIGYTSKFHCGDRVRLVDDSKMLYVSSLRRWDHTWVYQVSDGIASIEVKERELVMVDPLHAAGDRIQIQLTPQQFQGQSPIQIEEAPKADKET